MEADAVAETSASALNEASPEVSPSAQMKARPGERDSASLALALFVVVVVVGLAFYVVNGRKMWFFGVWGEEWDFLAGRGLSLPDLLRFHGDHPSLLPAFVFRVLFTLFGLRTYLPYQLVAIGAHLGIAAMLRVVMRRAGVSPWVANAAATAFVFFGAASQDILIAFQVGFSGALLFGLVQLIFADHNGPLTGTDWFGLLAGLASLSCSDVALVMIAAVGVASLLRRRWAAAAFHTLPLIAIYVVWRSFDGRASHPTTASLLPYIRDSFRAVFNALGHLPFVGWALAIILIVGLVVTFRDTRHSGELHRLSSPLGLLLGALIFASITGLTRTGFGTGFAASSRYLHVTAALILPAFALAADSLLRRSRVVGLIAVALLLVGIPGNMASTDRQIFSASFYTNERRIIESLPRMPLAHKVPRNENPVPIYGAEVTIGWLLDEARAGRIPSTSPQTTKEFVTNTLRLSIDEVPAPPRRPCTTLRGTIVRRLTPGESLEVKGAINVQLETASVTSSGVPLGVGLLAAAPAYNLVAVGESALVLRITPDEFFGAAIC